MRKPTQTDKLKHALKCLIENDALSARQILTAMLAPAPVKPKGIDAVTIALGHGIRRFNPDDAKAVKIAESTPCVLCSAPLKLARIAPWVFPAGSKYAAEYAHIGCVAKAEIERDRVWAELDAKRGTVAFDADKAATCLCGHGFLAHKRDSLENLLECEFIDYSGEQSKPCGCDHFRPGGTLDSGITHDADGNRDNSEPVDETANWSTADRRELARINADMIEADDREMGIAD